VLVVAGRERTAAVALVSMLPWAAVWCVQGWLSASRGDVFPLLVSAAAVAVVVVVLVARRSRARRAPQPPRAS